MKIKSLILVITLLTSSLHFFQFISAQNTWKHISATPIQTADHNGISEGDVSGRILAMAVSSSYNGNNQPALYISVEGAGIWRSTDFEQPFPTWKCISDNISFYTSVKNTQKIVIDPNSPNKIYITSSKQYANLNPHFKDHVILKSSDGGNTWEELLVDENIKDDDIYLVDILIDPTDKTGQTIYTSSNSIVYKSTNGGKSWNTLINTKKNATSITELEYTLDNNNQLKLYSSYSDDTYGVFTSKDGGQIWNSIPFYKDKNKTLEDIKNFDKIKLKVNHITNEIYAAISNQSQTIYKIYKFNNDGFYPTLNKGTVVGENIKNGFAFNISSDGTIYLGGVFPNQSVDGGDNWVDIRNKNNGVSCHPDFYTWAFYKDKVYAGNDGGVYRFTPLANKQAGAGTWESLNTPTLETALLYGAAQHPTNPNIFILGTQDNGTVSINSRKSIELKVPSNYGDMGMVLFDPDLKNNGKYVYTSSWPTGASKFFFRSDDEGLNWKDITPPDAQKQNATVRQLPPTYFAINPKNTAEIIVGIDRVYKSLDRGETWLPAISPVFNPGNTCNAIEYSTNGTIWIAIQDKVYRSIAGGAWEDMSKNGFKGHTVWTIKADPDNPSRVYVYDWGTQIIWRTIDNGNTWENVKNNLYVGNPFYYGHAFTIAAPFKHSTISKNYPAIFIGTEKGVSYAIDDGKNPLDWKEFNTGLPFTNVMDLRYNDNLNTLVVSTWGRGVYKCELNECAYAPMPTITPNGRTNFCTGEKINVTLTASNGMSYLWSNGANTSSITVTQQGDYFVKVTDNNGCSISSATVHVSGNYPEINLGKDRTELLGNKILPNIDPAADVNANLNNYTFSWQDGTGNSTFTINSIGNKSYSLKATSKNLGCSNNSSVNITSYCHSNGITKSRYYIDRFSIAQLNLSKNVSSILVDNQSGDNNGFLDYSRNVIINLPKQSPNFRITVYPSPYQYVEPRPAPIYYQVWIDYDHNGIFESMDALGLNEQIITNGVSTGSISRDIVIPNAAIEGITRMRVSMKYEKSPNPCDVNNSRLSPFTGEVEDYEVNISPKPLVYRPRYSTEKNGGNADNLINSEKLQVSVRPNPFSNKALLEIKGANANENFTLNILDIYGRRIKQMNDIIQFTIEISKDNLTSGIYQYQLLKDKSIVAVGKMLIQ